MYFLHVHPSQKGGISLSAYIYVCVCQASFGGERH